MNHVQNATQNPIGNGSREPIDIMKKYERSTCGKVAGEAKKISQRYSKSAALQDLDTDEKMKIVFKSSRLNAGYILGALTIGTSVGVGAGCLGSFVLGVTVCPFMLTPIGMGVGGVTGASIGATVAMTYCAHKNYFHDDQVVSFAVRNSNIYKDFKTKMTRETYELYLEFITNYFNSLCKKDQDKLQNYLCSFTLEVPFEPVFSPHDKMRHHPFERSEIEIHLANTEQKIRIATESGYSQEKIDEIKRGADPFRGEYFTKDQLVYDIKFCAKVIKELEKIHENTDKFFEYFSSTRGQKRDECDPVLLDAIIELRNHYQRHYACATRAVVSYLRDDILRLGGSYDTATSIGVAFYASNKPEQELAVNGYVVYKNADGSTKQDQEYRKLKFAQDNWTL